MANTDLTKPWLSCSYWSHIGPAPAGIDLIAGQVDLLFDQLASSANYIKSGKLRAVAVTSLTRAAVIPDVPTMLESGVPNLEATNVTGVLVPAGTSADIIARLHAAVVTALSAGPVRERFAGIGVEAVGSTPEQFSAYIKEDFARWTKVVKDANITVE